MFPASTPYSKTPGSKSELENKFNSLNSRIKIEVSDYLTMIQSFGGRELYDQKIFQINPEQLHNMVLPKIHTASELKVELQNISQCLLPEDDLLPKVKKSLSAIQRLDGSLRRDLCIIEDRQINLTNEEHARLLDDEYTIVQQNGASQNQGQPTIDYSNPEHWQNQFSLVVAETTPIVEQFMSLVEKSGGRVALFHSLSQGELSSDLVSFLSSSQATINKHLGTIREIQRQVQPLSTDTLNQLQKIQTILEKGTQDFNYAVLLTQR